MNLSRAQRAFQGLPPAGRAVVVTGGVVIGGRVLWSTFVRLRGLVRSVDDFRLLGIDYPALGNEEKMAAEIARAYPAAPGMKVVEVARSLDLHPYALANVINAESGWRHRAQNPTGGAAGLMQWIPSTAKSLGTSTQAILGMGVSGQLDLVQRYLAGVKKAHGSLGTISRLGMAVFYPAAMWWPPFAMFPGNVRSSNPGISVVADYIERMQDSAKLPWSTLVA